MNLYIDVGQFTLPLPRSLVNHKLFFCSYELFSSYKLQASTNAHMSDLYSSIACLLSIGRGTARKISLKPLFFANKPGSCYCVFIIRIARIFEHDAKPKYPISKNIYWIVCISRCCNFTRNNKLCVFPNHAGIDSDFLGKIWLSPPYMVFWWILVIFSSIQSTSGTQVFGNVYVSLQQKKDI